MKRLRYIVYLTFIVSIIFSACEKQTTELEHGHGALSGQVRRADWQTALAGVKLLNPYGGSWENGGTNPIMINPDGKFMVYNLDAGQVYLHFERYGFRNTTLTVTITKNDTLDLIVDMTREIPLTGRAFFWPYYATLSMDMIQHPLSSCHNYEDRMVLSSETLIYFTYTGSHSRRITLTLANPVTTGIINMADNQNSYCEFWEQYSYIDVDSLHIDETNYSTRHSGASGMVEILSINPTEHIIEGTFRDIAVTDGDTLNLQLNDGDFIGHW